jgi:hypothetical protein
VEAGATQLLQRAVTTPSSSIFRFSRLSRSVARHVLCAVLTSSDVSRTMPFKLLFENWYDGAPEDAKDFHQVVKLLLDETDLASIPQILRGLLSRGLCTNYCLSISLRRFLRLSNKNFSASHFGHTLALLCLSARQTNLTLANNWSEELSILVLACLRYAPWFTLRNAYLVLSTGGCSEGVAVKFLSCAAFVCHVTQTLDPEGISLVRQATNAALGGCPSSVRHDVLYNASAIYAAQGCHKEIFALYHKDPMLKPSRALVESHARKGNLQQALLTLYDMASAKSSMTSVPSMTISTCSELARLIGIHGEPADVHEFVRVMNRFRAPEITIARFLECIVRGICIRIASLPSQRYESTTKIQKSHAVFGQLVEAVMRYATANMNRGPMYALVAACLKAQSVEVALLCNLVSGTIAGSEMGRVRSVHSEAAALCSVSWVQHAALALGRDAGRMKVVEDLCAAWNLPSSQMLQLHSTVLWRCPSCNAPNSDRFSACGGCGTSRLALLSCACCSFRQDSTNQTCVVCSAKLSTTLSELLPLKPWACGGCNAMNEAHRFSSCAFCRKPRVERTKAETSPLGSCSKCSAAKDSDKQPYCKTCGHKEAHFVNTASHFLWQCGQCFRWIPWLEMTCTACWIGEKSGGCCVRPWANTQKCASCGHECFAFAVNCPACSASLRTEKTDISNTPAAALYCSKCCKVTMNAGDAVPGCASCGASMTHVERIVVRDRCCHQCREVIGKLNVTAICPCCAAALPHVEWSAPVLAASLKALGESSTALQVIVSGLELLVAHAVAGRPANRDMDEAVVFIAAIQSQAGPVSLLQRRALALCRKLLFALAPRATAHEQRVSDEARPTTCPECLGSHNVLFCPFSGKPWHCLSCGTANTNAGHGRYFCSCCHTARPEFASEHVTETWECKSCRRVVMNFESYCTHCGGKRQGDEKVLPLAPAVCGQCESLYLEPTCRACPKKSRLHDGVVCLIAKRYALIQPADTRNAEDRVLVRENLLFNVGAKLQKCQEVKYCFIVKDGRKLATFIQ